MYRNPPETFRRFEDLFRQLAPRLPQPDTGEPTSVENGGARLLRNPIATFETSNLRLIRAGIGTDMEAVDIIRIFNVLMYFDGDFRQRADQWALRTLRVQSHTGSGADRTTAR